MAGKTIVLGITASIAGYKAYDLIRALQQKGIRIRCVVTEDALQFVSVVTLQALLQDTVYTSMFGQYPEKRAIHLPLAEADAIVVAPATADSIAKVAAGIADELLYSVILATNAPVLFAPAMHERMWTNPITQANVEKLKSYGYQFVGPSEGALSDGTRGVGHIAPLEALISASLSLLP